MLNLQQIRDYNRGGSFAISNNSGDGQVQVEKTGFLHWLGSVLGFKKSLDRNEQTGI